jgi:mRNA interferase RelE/StbE
MPYEVKLHRHVVKTLEGMNPHQRARVMSGLRALRTDPYESRAGADIVRLRGTKGREDLFRLRIGDYRAVYAVVGKVVYVTDLFHRGKGYKQLP